MDRGVEGIGKTVGEHPPQAFIGQKTAHAGDLLFDRFGSEKPLVFGRALVCIRFGFVGTVPHLGFGAHFEAQLSALHQLFVPQVGLRIGTPVEPHPLDVSVLRGVVLGNDGERPARDFHFRPVEQGRSEPVASARRLDLVHAQRREDVPCRHLPHVLIARKPVGRVVVERRQHLTYFIRRLPRLAQHRVEVENVVARLVAVGILADQSRDVG